LNEIEYLWSDLPRFGAKFVKHTLRDLANKLGVEVPRPHRTALLKLAKAYDQYEFDMLIYDTMQAASLLNKTNPGLLEIKFESRPKKTPLIRVVLQNIGMPDNESFTPIVGFAAQGRRKAQLGKCLNEPNTTLQAIQTVVNNLVEEKNLRQVNDIERTDEDKKWVLRGAIYARPNKSDTKKWADPAKKLILDGVEVGAGTFCSTLVRLLEEGSGDFHETLSSFSRNLVAFKQRLEPTFKQKHIDKVHCRVLTDIETATNHLLKTHLGTCQRVTPVIKQILTFLKDYPLPTPAPKQTPLSKSKRTRCLQADLIKGSHEYLRSLKYELVAMEGWYHHDRASQARKIALGFRADLPAVLLQWFSLGAAHACDISADIRAKAYHKYVKKSILAGGMTTLPTGEQSA